MNGSVKYK